MMVKIVNRNLYAERMSSELNRTPGMPISASVLPALDPAELSRLLRLGRKITPDGVEWIQREIRMLRAATDPRSRLYDWREAITNRDRLLSYEDALKPPSKRYF